MGMPSLKVLTCKSPAWEQRISIPLPWLHSGQSAGKTAAVVVADSACWTRRQEVHTSPRNRNRGRGPTGASSLQLRGIL